MFKIPGYFLQESKRWWETWLLVRHQEIHLFYLKKAFDSLGSGPLISADIKKNVVLLNTAVKVNSVVFNKVKKGPSFRSKEFILRYNLIITSKHNSRY